MADETLNDKKKRLEEVRLAIHNIMIGGQSYQIGSRKLTRADLATLRAYEEELEAECNEGNPHLIDDTYVAFFFGTGR